LGYKIDPDLLVYASASTGFRGGGFNPRPFAADQINEFQPEKLLEYEVGLKSDWFDHKVRANVAAFYGDYKNLQFNSQLIQAGIPYTGIQNIGGANIYGYEVELQARPVGGLMFDGSIGYTGFKYKDLGTNVGCAALAAPIAAPAPGANCVAGNPSYSDYPIGQPKLKANVGAAYAFDIPGGSKLTPRLDVTYQTKVFFDQVNNTPGAILPSRSLLNGRVQWDAANGKWSVAALGTNLANKEYYVSLFDLRAFGEGMESGQPGAPREWAVNVHYKF
jgi:iron complex outermembrane receptor protein